MPPGRPAAPKSPTRYLNSKRRTIWHVSGTNKYVTKSEKGKMVYGPKVRYVKSPGGSERLLKNTRASPPRAIRPKEGRKMRINRGMKRGVRPGVRAGNLAQLFASPSAHGPGPVARRHLATLARKRRVAEKRTKLANLFKM
jgi:hypothetical protein